MNIINVMKFKHIIDFCIYTTQRNFFIIMDILQQLMKQYIDIFIIS